MAKFSTAKKFYLCSVCSIFLFTVIGKIIFLLYRAAASDIMIAGAASFFLHALPYISSFCAQLFSRAAFVAAVCSIIYAVSFFGKKTGGTSFLLSMLCLLIGDVLLFLYNITRNVVGSASIKAWALSALMEILFSGAILGLTFWIGCRYAVKRFHSSSPKRLNQFAPLRAAFLSLGITCILHIVILSANKVIPFFIRYQNYTSKELMDIFYDYGYYIFWYLGISFLLAPIYMKILGKATGRLRPKDYKAVSSQENASSKKGEIL
ncbi:MAG: hypothetical protein HFE66_08285 [Clostridiales bacterium]|nr:hypothetical protein [Clostridiales bacterium]